MTAEEVKQYLRFLMLIVLQLITIALLAEGFGICL